MKQIHRFFKRIAVFAVPLVTLVISTNVAFAKDRVIHSSVNRPRIQLIAGHKGIKQPVRKPRIRIKRRHRPVKRNNRKRQARFKGHYNIFNNASLRHFRVLKNSTRVNSRVPRMKTIMTFPNVYRGGRWPQSLNVDQNGHYAYIGFDSFANDGSKVMKYNLYRHHFSKIGSTFSGGHAQAVSIDHNGNLWFLNRKSNDYADDHAGPINVGSFIEVSPRSLKPFYYKNFRFGRNYMGDNLAFAGRYGVFNFSRIWVRNRTNRHYHIHMLVIYHTNKLNRRNNPWTFVDALRHTSGDYIIQATNYNPKNQRLYVASSCPTYIMSVPVEKVLKRSLNKKDVRISSLSLGKREIEGLSFDHKGYMYLLLGSPGQLLRSRRPIIK